MKLPHSVAGGLLGAALLLSGCSRNSETAKTGLDTPKTVDREETAIRDGLAKLSAEDRKLAEEQRWCAVENDNRLGSMGTPFKVMVGDSPVFLCCKGCRARALADPKRTLAKVDDLKAKAASGVGKEAVGSTDR